MAAPKTLFVGLDALCWPYLDPLLDAGRLPTLAALIARGSCGTLRSTLPAWTPTAWASIVTGKRPHKHGVWGMVARCPGRYEFEPTTARHRVGSPFWDRLNEAGLRVGLVNVPFVHPIAPLDGFAVAGFGTPNDVPDWTFPGEAMARIEEGWPGFRPAIDRLVYRRAAPEEIYRAERHHQRQQVEIATTLAAEYRVDVLVLNLMLADHANHYMPEMSQVEQALCDSDSDLQLLLDRFEPERVLLFSDHGSRRLKGQFLLQHWLRDQGYYASAPTDTARQRATLNWVLGEWLRTHHGWRSLPERAGRVALRSFLPSLPKPLQARIWTEIERGVPFARHHVHFSRETDFKATRLFPHSAFSGLFYLNVRGREPDGIVAPSEAASLLAEIRGRLLALEDPDTGEPLVDRCYSPEELYGAPLPADVPDLILDHYSSPWWLLETYLDSRGYTVRHGYFAPNLRQYGAHARDGLFVFAGGPVAVQAPPTLGEVEDLAPTLLYLYDLPIPDDYDGALLEGALEPAALSQRPPRYGAGDAPATVATTSTYSAAEQDELMDRLRALGYVS